MPHSQAVSGAPSARVGLRSLVLLHGLMGAVSNWTDTASFFQGRYRTAPVAFSLFEAHSPYHSVPSLTDFALQRMDDLGIRRTVLFGNSMGGQIALNMALQAPERVAALVLVGSAGLTERSLGDAAPLSPSRKYIYDRVRECFHDECWATESLVDEVHGLLGSTRNKLRLVKLARALREYNLYERLPEITCPALLVWGRQDTITPVVVAETFAERIPNARLHVLNECGHAPNIERSGEFNRLAEEFLVEIGYV